MLHLNQTEAAPTS